MIQEFSPKETDEPIHSYYPSGNIQEEKYFSNCIPANGWSRKLYYEKGTIQLAECYSNSLIIEQLFYDETGNLLAHKIYSHKQKQLIDKPSQTVVERPNVVSGCAHMGFYFKHLPAISKFIEAEYNEAALEKAYGEFVNTPRSYEEKEKNEDEWEDDIVTWSLQGKGMWFIIGFERGEGYYQWNLRTQTEEVYENAKYFMDGLN